MRRSVLLSVFILLFAFPMGCSDGTAFDPDATLLPLQAQLSTQPVRQFAFSDYAPLIPGLYGNKTYITGDGPIVSQIVGTEVVPYTPPIVGATMTLGSNSLGLASHDKKVWWLKSGGYVFSRVPGAYSAYPESAIIGRLHDGMILDMTGGERLWLVNASDPGDWEEVNTGYGDSFVLLIQVQDVRLPDRHVSDNWPTHKGDFKWHTYKDAIFMWALEPNRPDLEFQLDFDGLDEILGIQLPTAEDTNGWAIDGVLVWGKNVGVLFQGDIHLETGEFEMEMYLASQTHGPGG